MLLNYFFGYVIFHIEIKIKNNLLKQIKPNFNHMQNLVILYFDFIIDTKLILIK